MQKHQKLLIKNMVCQRCILTVQNIFANLDIPFKNIIMGEAELDRELSPAERHRLGQELNKVGFELIETRINKIVEDAGIYANVNNEKSDEKETSKRHHNFFAYR